MWGGINYAMSLEEMIQAVREVFNAIQKEGLIISKDAFKKIEDKYFTPNPHTNLTRIWGAKYLKRKINESDYLRSNYAVPNYVIVTDDPSMIKVKLNFGNEWCPSIDDLENATIYFDKIIGIPVTIATTNDIGAKSGIGYNDFSGSQNVIYDTRDGKRYIIDTEDKSFKIPIDQAVQPLLSYAAKRFSYLNNDIVSYTFEPLKKAGVKKE